MRKLRLIFDGKISKEDRAWVRSFFRAYQTAGLTVVLTDDWRQRVLTKTIYKKRAITASSSGVYWGRRNTGFLFGVGRRKTLDFPLIAVNLNKPMWKRTFLHEVGHWLQDTTEEPLKKYQRGKESYAEVFAEAEYRKIAKPDLEVNLDNDNSVMEAILRRNTK